LSFAYRLGAIIPLMSPQWKGEQSTSNDIGHQALRLQHPSEGLNRYEAAHELREFLKVACPQWSHYDRRGACNIDKVMAKLESIGVFSYWDLMQHVEHNTLNERLHAAGKVVFCKKTLDQFRHQKSFLAALENLRAPFYRQTGVFAPVPQMMSKSSLWNTASGLQAAANASCTGTQISKPRPRSEQRLRVTDSIRPATAGVPQRPDYLTAGSEDSMTAAAGRRPASVPSGELRSFAIGDSARVQSRPALRYIRTGKEHQCWTPITREMEGEAADTEASHGRSRLQSLELSASRRTSGTSPHHPESEAESSMLEDDVAKVIKAGSSMKSSPMIPRWSNLESHTLLPQAEAMLEEQKHMDEKRRLKMAMKREGTPSEMRKVITTKIKARIKDQSAHDAKGALDCHWQCTSIRKNLNAMANGRRDINNWRMQVERENLEKVDYTEKFAFIREIA